MMRTKLSLIILIAISLLANRTQISATGGRPVITAENASQVQQLHVLGQGEVRSIVWSLDGAMFIVSTTRGVWLYNAARMNAPPYHLEVLPISEVALSKDGSLLAAYDYFGPISIWNLKTRKLVRTITVPDQNPEYAENKILNVTFKPSGKVFITVGHERWDGFYVWDEDTDKVLIDVTNTSVVNDVVISPDQKAVTIAFGELISPQYVQTWDLATGKSISKMEGFESRPNDIDVTQDGSLIATANGNTPSDYGGRDDNVVALWDGKTHKRLAVLEGHTNWVKCVVFSPRGRVVASGSADGTVRLWDTQTHKLRSTFETRNGIVDALAFSPDGSLLAAATGAGKILVWRLADRILLNLIDGFTNIQIDYIGPGGGPDQSCCLAFSADSSMVAFGQFNGAIQVWDTNTGKTRRLMRGHKGVIWSVAFAGDNKTMISTGWDKTLQLWDAKTGRSLRMRDMGRLTSVSKLSPDGNYMILNTYNNGSTDFEVYKTDSIERIHRGWQIYHSDFSPDSSVLAMASFRYVEILSLKENKVTKSIRTPIDTDNSIKQIRFSADGKRLAIGCERGEIYIWDTEKAEFIKHFTAKSMDKGEHYFGFNADLTRAVVTNGDDQGRINRESTGYINVWDIEAEKRVFRAETRHLFDTMEFSPNGDVVALSGWHFGVELWDATTGKRLNWLHVPDGEDPSYQLQYFEFSPDGTLMGVVGRDDVITLYGVPAK